MYSEKNEENERNNMMHKIQPSEQFSNNDSKEIV